MKVPFSWLKEYVDIDLTAEELEEKLFGCGFREHGRGLRRSNSAQARNSPC